MQSLDELLSDPAKRRVNGAKEIAKVAGLPNERAGFHALEKGYIDADKIGRRWSSTVERILNSPSSLYPLSKHGDALRGRRRFLSASTAPASADNQEVSRCTAHIRFPSSTHKTLLSSPNAFANRIVQLRRQV
jgi:hypothetical protein